MCGIAGFCKTGETTPEQDSLIFEMASKLFAETQSRGTDASGFSYINKFGELMTVKAPIVAEAMVKEEKWLKLKKEMPMSVICHTRSMTLGDPLDNFNNHPLVVDKEISVIHNGMISNHLDLRTKYNLKGKGKVDSEVIPMLVKEKLKAFEKDNDPMDIKIAKAIDSVGAELSGGFACALLHKATPNVLYLFNHSNPIVLAYCESLNVIFFASTEQIMNKGFSVDSNFETKFKYFKNLKHAWAGELLSNNTVSVLKLENFTPTKMTKVSTDKDSKDTVTKKDLKFSLDFYEMNTTPIVYNGYAQGKVYDNKTQSYVWQDGREEKEKEAIVVLKKKNGFDGKVITGTIEDWETCDGYDLC